MTRSTTTKSANTGIGALRNRFTIEQPLRIADGSGGYIEGWSPIGTLWGAIRATSGDERFQHDRMSGIVSHEITVRHFDGLTPGDRFRLGAKISHLRAILAPDDRRRYLVCHCEERDL